MRIFNKNKTKELTDLTNATSLNGYFQNDTLITYHEAIKGQQEEGHYEVIKEYPNGGKDVIWIVDVPGIEAKDAWEETEEIQIFIEYTEEEKIQKKKDELIQDYKKALSESDYKIFKYLEGTSNDDEYYETVRQRKNWRKMINRLEEENFSLDELQDFQKENFFSTESPLNLIMGKDMGSREKEHKGQSRLK